MSKTLTPFENHLKDAMSNYEAPYDAQGWNDLQKRISGRSTGQGAWVVALLSTVLVIAAGTTAIYRNRNTPAIAKVSHAEARFAKQFDIKNDANANSSQAFMEHSNVVSPGNSNQTIQSAPVLNSNHNASAIQNNIVNPVADIQTSNPSDPALGAATSNAPAVAIVSNMKEACQGVEVEFQVQQPTEVTYLWNFGDGHFSQKVSPKHKFNKPGKYDVSLSITSTDGQISTTVIDDMITIHPAPNASFEWDFVNETPENPTVKIINTSEHASSYSWKFADGQSSDQLNPIRTFDSNGKNTVILEVMNAQGCSDVAIKTISVNAEYNLDATKTFNPNGALFMPSYLKNNKSNFTLSIFSADGRKVFETNNRSKGWDGKLPDGSVAASGAQFSWKVILSNDNSQDEKYFNGTLTINP
ncbi:MAG: PKD domain-containing protein [Flavobacteriales bacterium]